MVSVLCCCCVHVWPHSFPWYVPNITSLTYITLDVINLLYNNNNNAAIALFS